jgi:hypothetical protein
MKRHADYHGKEPEELYVAVSDDGFRLYVYESQVIRQVQKLLKDGKAAKIVKYRKVVDENK